MLFCSILQISIVLNFDTIPRMGEEKKSKKVNRGLFKKIILFFPAKFLIQLPRRNVHASVDIFNMRFYCINGNI